MNSRRVFFLFATTIFLSALLLFWIELAMAKILLPRLGGTPAVWNTCMLFFQVLLLAGYSYVLATTSWIGGRKHAILHSVLLLLSCLYLPLTLVANSNSISVQNYPALWLFGYLLSAIGLPIFLISTTSPLLQKWFTRTGHQSANDPYFLFAVSNAGSLLALVSYPLLLEPNLKLSRQTQVWAVVYIVFLLLSLGCVLVLWKSSRTERIEVVPQKTSISLKQRLYWILLAFIPSSLLFGVTTYITTEIAPTPLLWTIPLALYLITFILAFGRRKVISERLTNTALSGLALLLTLVIAANATEPTTAIVLLHLLFFFVAALVCHAKLSSDRPDTTRLADFYLCIALGGMLGGLFNTLVAPLVFKTLIEYPLVIVLACLIRPRTAAEDTQRDRLLDVVLPVGAGLLTIGLVFLIKQYDVSPAMGVAIVFGVPLILINHRFKSRPVRFALALGAVLLGSVVYSETQNRTLHVERNFFGTLSVKIDPGNATRTLYHGNTIHGRQFIDQNYRCEPLSYFHREGPLGQIFDAFNSNPASPNVAVVGLGAGSMACYSRPSQHWTFYEINPAVVGIAQDPGYFTYLNKCAAGPTDIVLGDARLQLQNGPDRHYGLIVLDAFNSDAIPVHLLTQEAIELYSSKLATGGILAFHISNRSLRLDRVLAELSRQRGAVSMSFADGEFDPVRGKDPSEWLVMGIRSAAFDELAQNPRWRVLEGQNADAWTDDFSNIVRVFRW
ncbi:MAG TPA: fused MFS/spermidine synthase, partial [Pyrinomonadaceae bacterium]|nr:fused MFS/spermidine synthase [Pyrinomonadaceae bacterium]